MGEGADVLQRHRKPVTVGPVRVIPGARVRMLPGQTHNVSATVLAPVLKEFFTCTPDSAA